MPTFSKTPAHQPADTLPPQAHPGLAWLIWHDRLLRYAFLAAGLVLAYQLAVLLIRPPWVGPVTDWLRAALAWPEMVVVVFVAARLTRAHRTSALSWCMLGAAMISYTIARNLWSVWDQILYPNNPPFPSLPDLFFVLQYPFFFLAVLLIPRANPWASRVRLILDSLLVIGGATALAWYFILAPIYLENQESTLGKVVSLAYTIGDLLILFGLTMALMHRGRLPTTRAALSILIIAFACLITADTWVGWSLLNIGRHVPGSPPDLFWIAFYLLLPLAGLVQLRLAQHEPTMPGTARTAAHLQYEDYIAALRFLLPFVAAILASELIDVRAKIAPERFMNPAHPLVVTFLLLLLVTVRQGVVLLENVRLQRERETARTNELVLREANRRMDVFLGMTSHELKTPITTLKLHLQLARRRLRHLQSQEVTVPPEVTRLLQSLDEQLANTEGQMGRLTRLVNELLDTSRIQAERLEIHLEPADLAAIVREAVEEQRQTSPERIINLHLPAEASAPARVDADRIGQVVTNYLTNALKYSPADQPIEVGMQHEGQWLRVWVSDQGPGIPAEAQAHIWERFHRVPGVEVQDGSAAGLGLGLYICKTIIDWHGGQVGVQSAPGGGSTFWFTLPTEKSAAI